MDLSGILAWYYNPYKALNQFSIHSDKLEMIRQIQKRVYHKVYDYAQICRTTFFRIYLRKYIKKHVKFRTPNELEYGELICTDSTLREEYDADIRMLNRNTGALVEELLRINTYLAALANTKYSFELFIDSNEEHLADQVVDRLTTVVVMPAQRENCREVINDITLFSFGLRNRLAQTHITAKMKIQEHLVERLPIYFVCVTGLLLMKLVDFFLFSTHLLFLQLSIVFFVYFVSIYMVYLRVFQSIAADTKKIASEQYKLAKRTLYARFTERCSSEHTYRAIQSKLYDYICCGFDIAHDVAASRPESPPPYRGFLLT